MKLYALSFILLLFDCGTHSQESLFDIDRVLSTCFKEWNAYLISISLCYCSFNNSALCQITLVTNKKLAYAVIGVLVDLAHPLLHIVEALHIRNVIDDNYPMSSPVVATGDGSESLLSCCVPLRPTSPEPGKKRGGGTGEELAIAGGDVDTSVVSYIRVYRFAKFQDR
jgi:hypothetical protein